jgi:hypothetical protein
VPYRGLWGIMGAALCAKQEVMLATQGFLHRLTEAYRG